MTGTEIMEICGVMINCATLFLLSFQDIKRKSVGVIPILMLALINVIFFILIGYEPLRLLTAVIPGLFSVLVSISTDGKMGLGDGLILIALGIACGWDKILAIWLVALVLSAVIGIILIIMKKADIKTSLPFVPFILAGYVSFVIFERTVKL